jgi:beta-aspartyl-peptidase (threonine type)
MKLVLAKWAADRVASGNLPQWVAPEAMCYLKERVNGHGGIILLDAQGTLWHCIQHAADGVGTQNQTEV